MCSAQSIQLGWRLVRFAVLQEPGEFSEATQVSREALAVPRRVLGAEHPHRLAAANNLASGLQKLGGF